MPKDDQAYGVAADELRAAAQALLDWLDYDFSRGIRTEEFEARNALRAALRDAQGGGND